MYGDTVFDIAFSTDDEREISLRKQIFRLIEIIWYKKKQTIFFREKKKSIFKRIKTYFLENFSKSHRKFNSLDT